MQMSMIRKKYSPLEVTEGAGVLVNRVFGYNETKEFDPFLMLDYFDVDLDPGQSTESPGFPWHPHKGMETISYFLRGGAEHQDSIGNKGIISEGELQWMSAGRGIFHQEMPVVSPYGVQGFQFWVNLPASEKLKKPDYQYIHKGEMHSLISPEAEVKVISGSYKGIEGPIRKDNLGITMLHVLLEPGGEAVIERDPDCQGFLFVFEGNGFLGRDELCAVNAYTLAAGKEVFRAGDQKVQFIYAQGKPLKEAIAWRGPIVMNTQQEVIKTFRDLENGTFISDDKEG